MILVTIILAKTYRKSHLLRSTLTVVLTGVQTKHVSLSVPGKLAKFIPHVYYYISTPNTQETYTHMIQSARLDSISTKNSFWLISARTTDSTTKFRIDKLAKSLNFIKFHVKRAHVKYCNNFFVRQRENSST